MVKFDIDKKGYDVEQVENYINTLSVRYEEKLSEQKDRVFTLRNEVNMLRAQLENYQTKDKQISKALIYAVEKADQIENSARKLYDLEIKRINILYERWGEIISKIETKFSKTNTDPELNRLIDEFEKGINSVLVQNTQIANANIKQELKNNSNNYIKNLLNKMDYVINEKVEVPVKPKKVVNKVKIEDKDLGLKSINKRLQSINNKLGTKHDTLVEAYLDRPELKENAYSKSIARKKAVKFPKPNESGFDLQDALNPKEDLDEIMKAFDFFNNATKK